MRPPSPRWPLGFGCARGMRQSGVFPHAVAKACAMKPQPHQDPAFRATRAPSAPRQVLCAERLCLCSGVPTAHPPPSSILRAFRGREGREERSERTHANRGLCVCAAVCDCVWIPKASTRPRVSLRGSRTGLRGSRTGADRTARELTRLGGRRHGDALHRQRYKPHIQEGHPL